MDKGAMANHVSIGTMLLRWKCSVYKVVYKELIVFMVFFSTVSLVYRLGLNEEQKQWVHYKI
jgi:bestrophin-3